MKVYADGLTACGRHNEFILFGSRNYIRLWFPLPDSLPEDVKGLIIEFAFDPLTDPW